MEFEAVLSALAVRVARLEPTEPGRRFINNAAVGWGALPIRLIAG